MPLPPRWTADQWEANNPRLLARDQFRCCCCGVPLRGRVERHHRQRRRVGGDRFSNLICLLPEHHAAAHANPVESRRTGLIVSAYEEFPNRVPLLLWGTHWVTLQDTPHYTVLPSAPA